MGAFDGEAVGASVGDVEGYVYSEQVSSDDELIHCHPLTFHAAFSMEHDEDKSGLQWIVGYLPLS